MDCWLLKLSEDQIVTRENAMLGSTEYKAPFHGRGRMRGIRRENGWHSRRRKKATGEEGVVKTNPF